MKEFKLCKSCNTQNDPYSYYCSECYSELPETILTSMPYDSRPVQNSSIQNKNNFNTGTQETPAAFNPPAEQTSASPLIVPWEPSAWRYSEKPVKELRDTFNNLQPAETQTNDPVYSLLDLWGNEVLKITKPEHLLGRNPECAKFIPEKRDVGKIHAKLILTFGELYIQNMSAYSFTYVNNNKISSEPHMLFDGDEIGLGGKINHGQRNHDAAYFIVKITKPGQ